MLEFRIKLKTYDCRTFELRRFSSRAAFSRISQHFSSGSRQTAFVAECSLFPRKNFFLFIRFSIFLSLRWKRKFSRTSLKFSLSEIFCLSPAVRLNCVVEQWSVCADRLPSFLATLSMFFFGKPFGSENANPNDIFRPFSFLMCAWWFHFFLVNFRFSPEWK